MSIGKELPSGSALAELGAGIAATRLAAALEKGDVMFVASSEQRAEAVVAALTLAAPDASVVHYPSSDALPGESGAASPANVGRRAAALRGIRRETQAADRPLIAFVTTAEAAAIACPPPNAFDQQLPVLSVGDALDLEGMAAMLEEIGYQSDDRVDDPGEMAVRGQVIDLFPADAPAPVRVEVEDGKILAIRRYDAVTQLSNDPMERIEIGRVSEPVAGERSATLFDHLPNAQIALDPGANAARDRHAALARQAAGDGTARDAQIVDAECWDAKLEGRVLVDFGRGNETDIPRFVEQKNGQRAFARFAKTALKQGDRLVILGAERDVRFLRPRLDEALGISSQVLASWRDALGRPAGSVSLLAMPVDRGWQISGLTVVAAADLLGSRALDDRGTMAVADPFRIDLAAIHAGDVVVHEDFGLAVVVGIEPMTSGPEAFDLGDALVLEHAAQARRLVSVDNADRVWRYGADADAVSLDKLDGSSWRKRRLEIDAAIAESARALTALAYERQSRKAPSLVADPAAYERFASGFIFQETPDQTRAIAAVRDDLAAGTPMDRLVVGDVGYGKTEVAMRAAAIAVLAGKQVVLAAPTTVLVRQHAESFARRFADLDVTVASLSRLSTPAERKRVKGGLADGSIAVVIGTGAVAAKGMAYQDLGLVIVDEEQRFGAAEKERLRTLEPNAHLLTLTATPIPRTLQTAMIGLQQLSLIMTPPARRQPIRTRVTEFDDSLVRTALLREKGRGGQSFVVVPRIDDMDAMADRLASLVPDLVVRRAHGKMPATEIDEEMVEFASGGGDVLLATNIIEAGLDVPRANTMIVHRADRFGLSQLHQLRGRVGRGGRRGQILLMTDPSAAIGEATLKRLRTLEALDRLGAGFAISARDLDMRGAGNLLGEEQAGHMKLIGIDLYQHLLEAALRTARGEQVERWTPELRIGISGRLPDVWIPEADVRISLYARLSRVTEMHLLDAFEVELSDRFGALPQDAADLITLARTRMLARAVGIERIDSGPKAIALTPRSNFVADTLPAEVIKKNGRILLNEEISDAHDRLRRLHAILESIAGD